MNKKAVLTTLIVLPLLAACSAGGGDSADVTLPSLAPSVAPSVATVKPVCNDDDPQARLASLRPSGTLPTPGNMPAGSFMKEIQDKGKLVLGTSQDTLLFSSRNPETNQIEGFDVDVTKEVVKAIFGEGDVESHIQYAVIPYSARVDKTKSGEVDIVADTMTVNCTRKASVDFSSQYYDSHQLVLVPKDSTAKTIKDFDGAKKDANGKAVLDSAGKPLSYTVCAADGSTSLEHIIAAVGKDNATSGVAGWGDCLVLLQQGKVDAISTDDTILVGLSVQDPYTKVLAAPLSSEPYGLAISKDHPEFTRFVNAVLERMRQDGTWARLYKTWVGSHIQGATPAPPVARYTDGG